MTATLRKGGTATPTNHLHVVPAQAGTHSTLEGCMPVHAPYQPPGGMDSTRGRPALRGTDGKEVANLTRPAHSRQPPGRPCARRQGGFSYTIAMFLVAAVALLSVRALDNSMTAERREKEADLLAVGYAYRNAIKMYYENSPGTSKAYPPELKSLLLDERATRLRRPLRKLYRDPMSGSAEWGVVRTETGTVKGVYSLSPLKPYKTGGFPAGLEALTNARQYRQWLFVYEPQ